MTMEMAIYVAMGIVTVWAIALVAWAVWSKMQEAPDFSFRQHIRNFKLSKSQYEKFASDTRMMMYLYVFLAGIESAKGNVSMAVTCGALFFGFQVVLYWVKSKWV